MEEQEIMSEIVTLCGSTKFKPEFEKVNKEQTILGNIVLAPGWYGHYDNDEPTEEQKTFLDNLHLEKIHMSSRIIVINVGGYIGESTKKEIEFAKQCGIKIEYLEKLDGI